jgi:hypothetical protein
MRSDARRRADRQGHTRSPIWEKSLTPLAQTAPRPASPSQDLEHQGKLAHGFTWGAIPTTANHDFKQQGCKANTERSSMCQPRALNPRPEGRGPPRYSVADLVGSGQKVTKAPIESGPFEVGMKAGWFRRRIGRCSGNSLRRKLLRPPNERHSESPLCSVRNMAYGFQSPWRLTVSCNIRHPETYQ